MKKVLSTLIISSLIWLIYSNEKLTTSYYNLKSDKIKNNFKILQISDMHDSNKSKSIIKKTKKEKPDIIVITGDLIDRQYAAMYSFVNELTNIAPVFYVSGNHETVKPHYKEILNELEDAGAVVLKQQTMKLGNVSISGIEDSSIIDAASAMSKISIQDNYNILLAHHPEKVEHYARKGFDLVLSGHAHGGQIIIPGVGGLYSPNQGKFPKYYKGLFQKNKTKMIVCAGVGGPRPRINNPPEICVITIRSK